jgi:hypothetical protein
MERTFRVTVLLNCVTAEGDDEESLKEAVKDALLQAIESDDRGEDELNFRAKEIESK